MYILLGLLLLANPVQAHHIEEAHPLTGEQICAAVADELDHAVGWGLLTESEANKIIIRCFVNYS